MATKIHVSQMRLYNPGRLKDPEIVASFVVRQNIYESILADLTAEKPGSRGQHHLIVGQRGMGKSTMLARLAAELRTDSELSKRFVPLAFPEEQYAIDRLSKFWLNCLDALADAAERAGQTSTTDRIDAVVRTLKLPAGGTAAKDEASARIVLEAFLEAAASTGQRPVLFVDNLNLVFERISSSEQHALREFLMRPGSPILIGASPSPPTQSQDYGAAFYDHFKIHYLRPLSADEMQGLMLKLAEITGRADVRTKVLSHPERVKTLRELTGGNPRTIVTLFFLYAEDFAPSVFADLENLLDRVTPLYKARIEELSDQQQVVVSAVANHWAPLTARRLAELTSLPMATISSQLDRLENIGFVERVELFQETAIGYQIAERFFNVWFLMRSASRRQRREVEFLVRFIESVYETSERPRLARHLMSEQGLSPDRHHFAKALAQTLDRSDGDDLNRHAELDALRQKAAESRRKLSEVIDFSQLPAATLAFDELRDKLVSLVPVNAGITPVDFANQVLGDRVMFVRREREKLAATNRLLRSDEIQAILASIKDNDAKDQSSYDATSVNWFRQRLATGQLRSIDDLEDWNRAFLKADTKNAVQLMVDSVPTRIGRSLSDEVFTVIQRFLTPQSDATRWAWNNWAVDLHKKLEKYSDAESAYRKAIELDPSDSSPWNGLGNLLQDRLKRYEEAESAYRKAIDLDPSYSSPWNGLGNLLQYRLNRYEAAESAYRKAIELDPSSSYPWYGLGDMLQYHLQRYEEAESAYRKAIDLDPSDSYPWNGLGNLYCDHFHRYSNAVSAFDKAAEIDEENIAVHLNRVFLYRDFLGDKLTAHRIFKSIRSTQPMDFQDTIHLCHALFAAYDANWGICREEITKALNLSRGQFPGDTMDDWFRASAVLLHLNYGQELLTLLQELGYDTQMQPWYHALRALHQGDRKYLLNVPVEVRSTAEYDFDQIEKRLMALPEATSRRLTLKPDKKKRNRATRN